MGEVGLHEDGVDDVAGGSRLDLLVVEEHTVSFLIYINIIFIKIYPYKSALLPPLFTRKVRLPARGPRVCPISSGSPNEEELAENKEVKRRIWVRSCCEAVGIRE